MWKKNLTLVPDSMGLPLCPESWGVSGALGNEKRRESEFSRAVTAVGQGQGQGQGSLDGTCRAQQGPGRVAGRWQASAKVPRHEQV